MKQKHEYIKKLYKEGNIYKLNNELNKIQQIIRNYEKELHNIITNTISYSKIESNIIYHKRIEKFIKKVQNILYKKLK